MASTPSTPPAPAKKPRPEEIHQVTFVTYPKLLFTWPVILLGFLLWPLTPPIQPGDPAVAPAQVTPAATPADHAATPASDPKAAAKPAQEAMPHSNWLGWCAWVYLAAVVIVVLTLGVDVDRNQAIFWCVLVLLLWIGGMYLRDVKGFTVLGDIYKWFQSMHLQYHRGFGLALSIVLTVPFLLMLLYAQLNDRWRITHNEFEHYAFGKADDSLGRGAKTIRTSYPDVFELLLGLAGTLIVYSATGTQELRRIPHVMFLPFIRARLNKILERTAVTTAMIAEEEEEA